MNTIETVPKESLGSLSYTVNEVLPNDFAISLRGELLKKAVRLGNEFHNKVGIIYQLSSGEIQRVETTIWDWSDRFIALKGGLSIPVHAVYNIEV